MTPKPPAEEHRAGPDGQQPAGEKGITYAGERQDQPAQRGARGDAELTTERGWPPDQVEQWWARALVRELLNWTCRA
ncbi:hypothetical protein [Streptomyces sp. 891-h]|uniref:hypothetical protein n=1 Tax=Streptomyces sp. 891-h TaxID=2720714 RepID=UPI002430384A|nr:hypothetical protein [Streptomyces sp. 891-h]